MRPVAAIVTFVIGLGLGALGASGRPAGWFGDLAPGPAPATEVAAVAPGSVDRTSCPDEAQLRAIVREELAAAGAAGTVAQAGRTPPPAAGLQAPVSSPEQVEFVNRQMDGYIRAGAISDAEMARLQSDIATLDPAARRAALQKLVRAMNTGALDGRL